ncbi:glycosyltransferase, partial [bacterium]|nr:glycosyltransferase [bacterium]
TTVRESLYVSWNRAIEESTTEYITNANTDDRHREDAFEILSNLLDHTPSASLAYGHAYISRIENETWSQNPKNVLWKTPAWFAPRILLHYPFGPQPLWRKSVHEKIGYFDPSFRAAGDWDWGCRFAKHFNAIQLNKPLGLYLEHENAISYRDDTMSRENQRVHAEIHRPEWVVELYSREGFTSSSPRKAAQVQVDMGLRALQYHRPDGMERHKFHFALTCFDAATKADPGWINGWNNLAITLIYLNQKNQAIKLFEQLSVQFQHPVISQNLQTLSSNGHTGSLATLLTMPSELVLPSNSDLENSRVVESRCVQPDKLRSSESSDRKDNLTELFNSAMDQFKNGNADKAFNQLNEILEIDPLNLDAIDFFRIFETRADDTWQDRRDSEFAERIKSTSGEVCLAWIQRSAQLNHAPKTMEAIWETLRNECTPQPPSSSISPEISIIMTVHNHEQYVEDAFRSIIAQTFREWELIIVDDNSIDSTPDILEKLIKEYDGYKIRTIRLDGVGVSTARNTGASLTNAPYLLMFDGDDILPATNLEELYSTLQDHPEAGFAWPLSIQLGEINRIWSYRPFNVHEHLCGNRCPVNSLMRRELFDSIGGFNPDMIDAYEDWEFWVRAIRHGYNGFRADRALFLYRKLPGSRNHLGGKPTKIEINAKCKLMELNQECYLSITPENESLLVAQLRIHNHLIDHRWVNQRSQGSWTQPEVKKQTEIPIAELNTIEKQEDNRLHPAKANSISRQKPVRVLFYFFKNVHIPILLPIFEELRKQPHIEIAFSVFAYNREIRAGMEPEEHAILEAQGVPILDTPQEWDADVSFMADNVAHLLDGCGKIINVGHGLLSKGQYFTDTDVVHRENLEHLLCVPGEYHRQRLVEGNKVFIPIVATGFPKLDRLFSPDAPSRDELMRASGLDPTKRVVLFAPTFNMSLSAIPILWTRVAALANEDTYLLIKLHSSSFPEFKKHYSELAQLHDHIFYVDEPDITNSLLIADVMVSDVSSAFMEFMALDKPVVLFDNPNIPTYRNFDPRDIEYAWRDVGIRCSTMEEVIAAVERSFEFPEELSEKRKHYAEQLLADRNGNASENVIQAMYDLLAGKYDASVLLKENCILFIPVQRGEEKKAVATAKSVFESGGDNVSIHFVDHGCKIQVLADLWEPGIDLTIHSIEELRFENFSSSFIGLTLPGNNLGDRRLFRILNHLRRNPECAIITPLLSSNSPLLVPQQDVASYVQSEVLLAIPEEELDSKLRSSRPSKVLPTPIPGTTNFIAARSNSQEGRIIFELAKSNSRGVVENATLALDVLVEPLSVSEEEMAEMLDQYEQNTFDSQTVTTNNGGCTDVPLAELEKIQPSDGRLRMAIHFARKGDIDKAIEHAETALEEGKDPNTAKLIIDHLQEVNDSE